MKNILIVGCGGIGSWLCSQLYNLKLFNQIKDVSITVADDDTVDTKNLPYQKFEEIDLLDIKSEVMGSKYGFKVITERIVSESELNRFDCVISCVDNTSFRKLLFNWAFKSANSKKYWIDLRSEGRSIAAFCKNKLNTKYTMMETLGSEEVEEGSCQLEYELSEGIVQIGNRIVATIGAQYLLNYLRNQNNVAKFVHMF